MKGEEPREIQHQGRIPYAVTNPSRRRMRKIPPVFGKLRRFLFNLQESLESLLQKLWLRIWRLQCEENSSKRQQKRLTACRQGKQNVDPNVSMYDS